jgi:hypothetical protein
MFSRKGRAAMRFFRRQRNWGLLLLGIYLIVSGVLPWIPSINAGEALRILAIVAGVLIVLGER